MNPETLNIELLNHKDSDESKIVTIENYLELVEAKDRGKIAEFIYLRLFSRYIKPFTYENETYKEQYKNGFSMMANFCLLIETVESFKNGWRTSDGKGKQAFQTFFTDNQYFPELEGKGGEIYKHIRCGILHQGETTGGWKITRNSSSLVENKTINAFKFLKKIELYLKSYRENLESESWDSKTWDNFRVKMRKIISNCSA